MANMEEYINRSDLLVLLIAEIEFSRLVGNTERVKALSWAKDEVCKMPIMEVTREDDHEPILYRHTEERE